MGSIGKGGFIWLKFGGELGKNLVRMGCVMELGSD